jgi:hypothetical protein
MTYNTNEVLEIVKECLGENPKGIFAAEAWITDGIDSPFYTDFNLKNELKESPNYTIKSGCTRVVIIPNDKPYVIKLPITGIYDNKTIQRVLNEETCDAFSNEIGYYDDASEDLQSFLLPNIYICSEGEVPIYIQEKIAGSFCDFYSIEENFKQTCKLKPEDARIIYRIQEASNTDLFKPIFIKDLGVEYGEAKAIRILKEIKDLQIMDIHGNNYGYTRSGRPCLFDYGEIDDDMWI